MEDSGDLSALHCARRPVSRFLEGGDSFNHHLSSLGLLAGQGPAPQASAGSWPTAVSLSFVVVSQTSPLSLFTLFSHALVLFASLQKSKQNCRHVSRSCWHPPFGASAAGTLLFSEPSGGLPLSGPRPSPAGRWEAWH